MFQSKITTVAVVLLGFLFYSSISSLGYAQDSTRVVVTTGDAAPDGNGTFSEFFELRGPGIANTGQATFVAELTGTDADDARGSGIFRGNGTDGLSRIVREDQLLPTGDTVLRFFRFDVVAANNVGQFAFDQSVRFGNGSVNQGLFVADQTGNFARIARGFDAAPDGNGEFGQFLGVEINDAGQTVFSATLDQTSGGESDDRGLYIGNGLSTPVQIAREGQLAPGGNGTFALNFSASGITSSGQIAFQTDLRNTSGGDADNNAVYLSGVNGGLTKIARTGDAGPDGDGTFSDISNPALNSTGQILFHARLSGATNGSQGLFIGDGTSELRTVSRSGDQVENSQFTSFRTFGFDFNNSGSTTFVADIFDLDNGRTTGVFLDDGVGPNSIALIGQVAPDGNGTFSGFNSLALNEEGQFVFGGSLAATSGGETDDDGLFFFDDTRGLIQIVREGELLLGSEITNLIFDEQEAFNDLGQVAYRFELADGREGVAIWTVGAAVPPPITGNFDADGDVDGDDVDFYIGNLNQPATGALAQLDLNGDGNVTIADHDLHVTTLVVTSNGVTGALLGDVDLDGTVNVLSDAFPLVGSLGQSVTSRSQGDLNADGVVDVLGDAFILISDLGQSNEP